MLSYLFYKSIINKVEIHLKNNPLKKAQMLLQNEKLFYICTRYQLFDWRDRRNGRVVECGSLENC
jgi:hypothetical protein|tara:strand:+ start:3912 stop:4106 length:195 start_codon:yes stop_codon:yes gene_type:complete